MSYRVLKDTHPTTDDLFKHLDPTYTGTIDDKEYAYLNAQGATTGSISDRRNALSGGAPTPSFDPTDIPELMHWWDPSDASNRTLSGSSVTGLADKAGSEDLVPNNASSYPVYEEDFFTSGTDGMRTGTNQSLLPSSGSVASGSYQYVVCIHEKNSVANNNRYKGLFRTFSVRRSSPYDTYNRDVLKNEVSYPSATSILPYTKSILEIGPNASFPIFEGVGEKNNSNGMIDSIWGEIMLFSAEPSSEDLTALRQYLYSKYDITP